MADADPITPAGADTPSEADAQALKAARLEKRRLWLTRLALVVGAAAIIWGLWYLLIGRNHVSTDNAYVAAEVAQVTPLVAGQVVEVRVSDTQAVKKGDVLIRLDDANARLAYQGAAAELTRAQRMFRQATATSDALAAQVDARRADIARAAADYEQARIDLDRRLKLQPSGAVSGEELTSARKAFAAARAGLAQARSNQGAAAGQLAANQAMVSGATVETDPMVLSAKAKLAAAKLDLDRTVIRAPIDGIVTRRQVQVGQRVATGNPVMMIVPVSQVYVDANFKERQLRRVKPGQPATLTADLYGGDVVYHGRVVGFSGGTGSAFALIPAQNATGNWIKVVQRLPVRIALDPKELAEHPLRVGLSMEAEIDVSGD
ncbi:EmrA/EmrK family multidrug efflux transporter periplasmic adaptor subunit [Rhizorhabdus dicambivorans]|uniref:EmrA/EmrK family multidrug efflux transporter periplasmic adaptor subunit n=1 Tax=Rhizorhabdus dicambivorans TaxID=1850238 RepID=A0A2A4FW14_9SPHN|nr:EmrA/EmrK family multidrug efflux transporter periplasmic adaptor subunit [Rhizorhabdus dicambivorans]ATE64544.1 EmrA/EmrK family multidrug efflux transporter periplasmic adaptor subunit [Rhizorhabdus dicambivorans]PCE41638.1 EmrA/EmrK family multidrug efflux transporter periplasmic adaptor subunit [Rhizorhabdus dicambivorans]